MSRFWGSLRIIQNLIRPVKQFWPKKKLCANFKSNSKGFPTSQELHTKKHSCWHETLRSSDELVWEVFLCSNGHTGHHHGHTTARVRVTVYFNSLHEPRPSLRLSRWWPIQKQMLLWPPHTFNIQMTLFYQVFN